MKDTETRTRTTTVRKGDESEGNHLLLGEFTPAHFGLGLPRAASWAAKGHNTALHNQTNTSQTRQPRKAGTSTTRQQRSGSTVGTSNEAKAVPKERKTGKDSTKASSSRPATPGGSTAFKRPTTPTKTAKPKEVPPPVPPPPPRSPASSAAPESDIGSGVPEASPSTSPPEPAPILVPAATSNAVPAAPPGLPAVPPGLSTPSVTSSPALSSTPAVPPGITPPPGLPLPNRQANAAQSSYQMSTQAQALVEDIMARRESAMQAPATNQSPFPEFDRMLQTLTEGDNGFSFNLDPKLAGDDIDTNLTLPDLETEVNTPFGGTFLDAFPGLRPAGQSPSLAFASPPGIAYPQRAHPLYDPAGVRSPILETQSTGGSSYTGSFNPFAESTDEPPARRFSPLDEERKVSRFGFARGRQGSSSSPLATASPVSHSDASTSFFNGTNDRTTSPAPNHAQALWGYGNRHPDYIHSNAASAMSSPLLQQAQANAMYHNHQHQQQHQHQHPVQAGSRFQPFETSVSEAQLRELINQSRDRANARVAPTGRTLTLTSTHSSGY